MTEPVVIDGPPATFEEVYGALGDLEEEVLQTFQSKMTVPGTIYSAHFLLWGAGNRTVSQIRGFVAMLQSRNFTCSAAILRMQLDTVLRLFGGFKYGNLAEYAEKIFHGEMISRLKSAEGHRLSDRFLSDELSKQLPWIATVYERSSGSIHLSRRHIMLALGPLDENGQCNFQIGPSDRSVDEELFIELGQAFAHTTKLAIQMIEEWFEGIPRGRN